MGHIYAKIRLSNPRESEVKPVEVNALVDTGAITLCLPEHIAFQLKLIEIEKREVTTADGRSTVVSYVGPIRINFENRTCFTGGLILGDLVLMGCVPMEDMDLVLNPTRQTITTNPDSPNIPHVLVK
ncbi:MAG: clan AA aspartic protease [Candidatus Desantisbacteria bacterium]